jgi:hypothetical protein
MAGGLGRRRVVQQFGMVLMSFRLLAAVDPTGVVRGFGFSSASTADQQVAETFFAVRATQTIRDGGGRWCAPFAMGTTKSGGLWKSKRDPTAPRKRKGPSWSAQIPKGCPAWAR